MTLDAFLLLLKQHGFSVHDLAVHERECHQKARTDKQWVFSQRLQQRIGNLSIEQVADKAGLSPATIRKYLYGAQMPSFQSLVKLCDAFGWLLGDLVDDVETLNGYGLYMIKNGADLRDMQDVRSDKLVGGMRMRPMSKKKATWLLQKRIERRFAQREQEEK